MILNPNVGSKHADSHKKGGVDQLTPEMIGAVSAEDVLTAEDIREICKAAEK